MENSVQKVFNKLLSSFYAPKYEWKYHNNNQQLPEQKYKNITPIKYTKNVISHKKIHISNTDIYIKHCFTLCEHIYIVLLSDMSFYSIDTSSQLKNKLLNITIDKNNFHFIPFSSHSFLYKHSNSIYLYNIISQQSIVLFKGGIQFIKSICILKYHPNLIVLTFKGGIIKILDIISKKVVSEYEDNDYGSWYTHLYEIDENRIILYKKNGKRAITIDMKEGTVSLFLNNAQIVTIEDRFEDNNRKYIECKLKKGVTVIYDRSALKKLKEEKELMIKGDWNILRFIINNKIYYVKFSTKRFVIISTLHNNKVYTLMCEVNYESEEILFAKFYFNTIYIFTKNSIYTFNNYSEVIKEVDTNYVIPLYLLNNIAPSNKSSILSSFKYNNDVYSLTYINSHTCQLIKNASLIKHFLICKILPYDYVKYYQLTVIVINKAIYIIGKMSFFVYDINDGYEYNFSYGLRPYDIYRILVFNCFDDLFISLICYTNYSIGLIRYNYKKRKVITYEEYCSDEVIDEDYGNIKLVYKGINVYYEIGDVQYNPNYVIKVKNLYAVLCEKNKLKLVDKENKTKCEIEIDLSINPNDKRIMEDISIKYFNDCIYVYNYEKCYVVKYYEDINQLYIIQCYSLKMPLPYINTNQKRYNYTISNNDKIFVNYYRIENFKNEENKYITIFNKVNDFNIENFNI